MDVSPHYNYTFNGRIASLKMHTEWTYLLITTTRRMDVPPHYNYTLNGRIAVMDVLPP